MADKAFARVKWSECMRHARLKKSKYQRERKKSAEETQDIFRRKKKKGIDGMKKNEKGEKIPG